jgi:hypothetical protein
MTSTTLVAAGLTAVALGALTVPAAHAATGARYASPKGSGTVCSHSAPCNIIEAVDQAPLNSEVILEPGNYGTAAAPLTTEITDAASGSLNVHGVVGQALPVITSAADYAIRMQSSRVSHLSVIATGTTGGVLGTLGDHLQVRATNTSGPACSFSQVLSESVCVGSGDTTDGVGYTIPGSQLVALNNVTAIADGAHAEALSVDGTGAGLARVNVSSSIFVGTTYDVGVSAAAGGQAEINISHSRYATLAPVAAKEAATVNDVGGNIKTAPVFVNAAAGNYREQASSPTVDAGTKDPDFTTDLADNPRSIGTAADMGAYELLVPPKVVAIRVTGIGKHSVSTKVTVKPLGLPGHLRILAKSGHHHMKSHPVAFAKSNGQRTVDISVHGLARHTTYQLQGAATTKGGHDTSPSTTVTTH